MCLWVVLVCGGGIVLWCLGEGVSFFPIVQQDLIRIYVFIQCITIMTLYLDTLSYIMLVYPSDNISCCYIGLISTLNNDKRLHF